jgi:hypothetical protein
MHNCLATNCGRKPVAEDLRWAKTEPWASVTGISPVPPPKSVLTGLRASTVYDPTPVLERTTVPTLVLSGSLDRNADVRAAGRGFRADFAKSGIKESRTGYDGDEIQPTRVP